MKIEVRSRIDIVENTTFGKMASALSRVSAIAMEATRDLQDRMRSVSPGNRQGGGGEIGEIRGKLDSRCGSFRDNRTRLDASE